MAIRHRPTQEFEETPNAIGSQLSTLTALSGGYNGYSQPELLSPQMWAQASNVYSGQFGAVRRARMAPVVNASTSGYAPQGARFSSLFNYRDATPQNVLVGDIGQTIWSFNITGNYSATQITDSVLGTNNSPLFTGPWSRYGIQGIAYGMNGQIKRHFRGVNLATMENWGIDTPDAAPVFANTAFGPQTGTTVTTGSSATVNWTNPSDIIVNGGTPASLSGTLIGTQQTQSLSVTGFGFSIPTADSIIGIQVTLKGIQEANIPNALVQGASVQLMKTSLLVGSPITMPYSSSATAFNSAGGQGNMWGTTWSPAYVNATGFGVQILPFVHASGQPWTPNMQLYYVEITIYTLGGGPGNITKVIGRSYTWAWENANTGQVSAPSPATNYVPETATLNIIEAVEAGSATTTLLGTTVQISNATVSPAWVNRQMWISGIGGAGLITAVNTTLNTVTLQTGAPSAQTNVVYQIYDEQSTNIRLYATGDGQPVYFRIQRNAWVPTATDPSGAGLVFIDNDNSEPPDGEFTQEIQQLYNIPPPIGTYVAQYQSRLQVFGVAGAPQSFFYSNFENTSVGLPWDSFAPLNQVTMPMGNAQLRGVAALPTGQILWSSEQDMFKLTGLLTDNVVSTDAQLGATVQQLPYKIGCASFYAVQVTSLGAIWLSSDRQVWLFTDHYAPKNIGQPVQDILNTINGARLQYARMYYYKQGEKNWLELSIATGASTFNNVKLILDIDLLASNGQASFFTFDMATNQPTWYVYNVNCEADEVVVDSNSIWHTLSADVDVIIETDWTPYQVTATRPAYFSIGAEQTIAGAGFTTHALGNEAPEIIKNLGFLRVTTNQLPKYLSSQGWKWVVNVYDDDKYVLGVQANTVSLVPGVDSSNKTVSLESSAASFRFGGVRYAIGRRFQFQTNFPSLPGFWEFRSFQVKYQNIVAR
jgi:hypothetical protein